MVVQLNTDYNRLLAQDRPRCLCAEYQAVVVDRMTLQPLARLPLKATDGRWTRELNQTSEAEITVHLDSPLAGNCCEKLNKVSEWGHELIITRAGDRHACWIGPIVTVREQQKQATFYIRALDRTAWFTGLPIPVDLVYGTANPIDASLLFEVEYNLVKDQLFDPQLALVVTPTGVLVEKTLVATDTTFLTDELSAAATAAADWTVVGSTLLLGGKQVPAPYITLKSSMWVDPGPDVAEEGRLLATHVKVLGDQVSATFPLGPLTPHPFFGLRVFKVSDDRFKDYNSCLAAAQSIYELHSTPAVFVTTTGSSLGPKSSVLPPQLIPGQTALIAIESGCRASAQTVQARLSRLEVQWTAGYETSVLPDFQPAGSIDVVVGGYQ